jgi:putative hydrolase of the HAD superfamily
MAPSSLCRRIAVVDRAVLWDFDGTLAARSGRWSGCLVEAPACVAPDVAASVSVEALRAGLRSGFPWQRPAVAYGVRDGDAWWAALAPVLAAAYQLAGVPSSVAVAAAARVRECYVDPARWVVFEDVGPALAMLGTYRHVVLSNHVPELPALVAALGIPVDAVVTSAAVGWEKPHAEMFAAGVAAAGSPGEVWMVGDDVGADVRGAESYGIPAILVRTGGAPGLIAAARVIAAGRVSEG